MTHAGNLTLQMREFFGDCIISRNFGPLDLRIYDHRFSVIESFDRKGLKKQPAYILRIETNTSSYTDESLHRIALRQEENKECTHR
jgi:hypothetical protein